LRIINNLCENPFHAPVAQRIEHLPPEQGAASSSLARRTSYHMIIVNRQHAAIINTPHGSEIRPLIDRTTSGIEECSLAEEVLPVGAAVGRHHHVETEEIYYILQGTGRMTVGSEVREVEAGDAVFIPRRKTHTLENTGKVPMTILLVCGPAYSYEDHHVEEGKR
jgi:mannose-6-phosphate isomerase-like protein (cupin superfamily)